ncbi:MAG: glycosyltransferase, partial [Methylobacter sp.]|nr:glycosyltransferase [Methylobacter sp.]
EAIEGVIKQIADFPIELVIAEDCSADNTREIALAYQCRYPQLIRVIYSDKNVGMMANWWRALDACRGEFIAFCEGDDYWIDPDKLRQQVAVLRRFNDIDITFHSCYEQYENENKKTLSRVVSSTDKLFSLPEIIAGDGNFMPSASLLIRRSLLVSTQDWFESTKPPLGDYFIQVFGAQRGGGYYINKPMSIYRISERGWTRSTNKSIDSIIAFETKYIYALKKLEQIIPGQKEALKNHIVGHYAYRFIKIQNEDFARMKELVLPVLIYLYQSEAIEGCTDEQMKEQYFMRFAVDGSKAREMRYQESAVFHQFLRVAKSLFDYSLSLMTINLTHPNSSGHLTMLVKWKAEAQRSFLNARWQTLFRLLIGNR